MPTIRLEIQQYFTFPTVIYRDRKKLQMQLNFEKRNLKSCNGSLRFIRKGSKWQIFLCNLMQFCASVTNLMQFCAYVAIQCNFAIISAIFLKKKGFGLMFYAI